MAIEVLEDDNEQRAQNILTTAEEDQSTLPDALLEILTKIIKPLFSSSQHLQLTATGRKRLVSTTATVPGSFSSDSSVFDNSRPWKNGWTTSLLLDMLLRRYYAIVSDDIRRRTIEAHFHLVIPPILNMIDDVETIYKVQGCNCLTALCDLLISVQSDMMKRTGLTDVFIDALKGNFIYTPPITAETEALSLLEALYPAFFALVAVRFQNLDEKKQDQTITTTTTTITSKQSPTSASDTTLRQNYLTLLLRHSLLHTLTTLSPSINQQSASPSSSTTTTTTAIPTFLLSQLPLLVHELSSTNLPRHIPHLLPLLRRIISDPFAPTGAPEMVLAAIVATKAIVMTCSGTKGVERWWAEILRGIVACWLNVMDDIEGMRMMDGDRERREKLEEVKVALRGCVEVLRGWDGGGMFEEGRQELLKEEEGLEDLFVPVSIE